MKPKFFNRNGDLSPYSFYCGYVQSKRKGDIVSKLYYDGNYHVKKYNVVNDELELIEWNTFEYLTPARKDFNR